MPEIGLVPSMSLPPELGEVSNASFVDSKQRAAEAEGDSFSSDQKKEIRAVIRNSAALTQVLDNLAIESQNCPFELRAVKQGEFSSRISQLAEVYKKAKANGDRAIQTQVRQRILKDTKLYLASFLPDNVENLDSEEFFTQANFTLNELERQFPSKYKFLYFLAGKIREQWSDYVKELSGKGAYEAAADYGYHISRRVLKDLSKESIPEQLKKKLGIEELRLFMPMHKIQVNLSDYPSVIALFEGLVENFDKDEVIDLGRVDDPSFTVDGTFVTLPIIAEGQEELYRQGTIANELVHYLVDKYLDGKVPLQVNEFLSDAASVAVDPLTEIPRIHKHNWKQYRKSVRHMAEQLRIGLGRRSKLFDYDFLNSLIDEEPEKVRELVLEVLRENCSDEQQFVKDLQASYKKKAREFIKQHLPQQGD